ncbi:MAG TPA: HEAT repeat domain-containing protein [Bryobacteraceae bacterium]|nr:HEAT repeat domain-containing protein [Bryobacteraceae bacterium]
MIRRAILFLIAAGALLAQGPGGPYSLGFQAQQSSREDTDYRAGRQALDSADWMKAVASFKASAARKGPVADAALYWTAYALNRAGHRAEAIENLKRLQAEYPSSRWIDDAKALELQMGAPVSMSFESGDDLKIIAINSLMQSDPKQAFPILQHVLQSSNSPQLKEKALFVLTQSPLPEARKLIGDIAHGGSGPEMQEQAIKYMGMMGGDDSRKELVAIYQSTSDRRLKQAILHSLMVSGGRGFLVAVAKGEKDHHLRADAIRQLALTGGQDELWELYQSTTSMQDKEEILKSMFIGGNSTKLAEVAQNTGTDVRLRIAAVHSLGLMGGGGRADVLIGIYKSDANHELREAVVRALFIQGNAKALVELAKAEKDPEMKRAIVQQLSVMGSKDATDYMMEILK